jgi:2-phosphosulfolactate phosphatase
VTSAKTPGNEAHVADVFDQSPSQVRFEWGLAGAEALGRQGRIAVIVDVLTFTTTVSVAMDAGIGVFPYPLRTGAADHARRHAAALAVSRSDAVAGEISLSPATLRGPSVPKRLVLPSPNGSTISHALMNRGCDVGAASLRNRTAVADWLAGRLVNNPDTSIVFVAAGEKWPQGSLRPAVEDLWGAGAVIESLVGLVDVSLSEEALVATASYRVVAERLDTALAGCSSGKELIAMGFPDDVVIAGECDASGSVPLLRNSMFENVF